MDEESMVLGTALEHVEIAPAMAAKFEVIANNQAPHSKSVNQQTLYEIIRRTRSQRGVKRQD